MTVRRGAGSGPRSTQGRSNASSAASSSDMNTTSAIQDEVNAGAARVESARRADARRIRNAQALFLAAAGGSFFFSIYLWFLVDREQGLFVGLWVPSILALGALLLSGRGASR